MAHPMPPENVLKHLRKGQVIPAHPLALDHNRKLDERRQRALTRYYCASGAGGVAVGVHTTQFAIRDPKFGLFKPVIEMASEVVDDWGHTFGQPLIKVGGICGQTAQAVQEAEFLAESRYHIGLVSLGAMREASVDELVEHTKAIASVIPVMGFYLQPAVGGRVLPVSFWRRLAEIPNVVAIKVAPFNRYQTLDVAKAIAETGRINDIALYTGNDDCIVFDLLTTYRFSYGKTKQRVRFVGGLLGHWAFWTREAVRLLESCHRIVESTDDIPQEWLTRAAEVTDSNAAAFDPTNGFAGCIPGIHEILRRQGLLEGLWTLDPNEVLSPGQKEEIDRVYEAYPHLNDDEFIAEHLDEWLA